MQDLGRSNTHFSHNTSASPEATLLASNRSQKQLPPPLALPRPSPERTKAGKDAGVQRTDGDGRPGAILERPEAWVREACGGVEHSQEKRSTPRP